MNNTFKLIKQKYLPALKINLQIFEHRATKAKHFHFHKSEESENCFAVFFKTLPADSKGIAHILEHTVLNGSAKFDVKNPFDLIMRTSLNSFINAMTAADWTAYPFASSNLKDFDNLLQVYLDAVFFPNLAELDFAQEGHRLEFENNDSNSKLQYKGVVYNEMKGANSSAYSVIYDEIFKVMYSGTTYEHNSGGDQKQIVNLSHSELLEFHQKYYQPSNAIFATYGNLSAESQQHRFEELALQHFKTASKTAEIADAKQFNKPKKVIANYPLAAEIATANSYKNLIVYRLPQPQTALAAFEYRLLSACLLFDSNCVLTKTLEQSKLGINKSVFTGMLMEQKQPLFICGLDDCSAANGEQLFTEINNCLTDFVTSTMPKTKLDAILRTIELSYRKISSDSYPYGISLLIDSISEQIHDIDCSELLDLDSLLEQINQKLQNPNYIQNLCKQLLLNNYQYCIFSFVGNHDILDNNNKQEQQQLAQIQQSLSEQQKQEICDNAQKLLDWQQRQDNPESLPKVTTGDINQEQRKILAPTQWAKNSIYSVGSNGVSEIIMHTTIDNLSLQQWQLLPIYCRLIGDLGFDNYDYKQASEIISSICSDISCDYNIKYVKSITNHNASINFRSSCLDQQLPDTIQLINKFIKTAKFTETARIKQLLIKYNSSKQNFISSAHRIALLCASRNVSNENYLANLMAGKDYLLTINNLVNSFDTSDNLNSTMAELTQLHTIIKNLDFNSLVISDKENCIEASGDIYPITNTALPTNITTEDGKLRYWSIASKVNYCAQSLPLAITDEFDKCTMNIVVKIVTDQYLNNKLREINGAYGGGAIFNSTNSSVNFFSYRDPELAKTFDTFNNSIDWLLNYNLTKKALDQGIIQFFATVDKAMQPIDLAKYSYFHKHQNIDMAMAQKKRSFIKDLTVDQVKACLQKYLANYHTINSGKSVLASKQPDIEYINMEEIING